jgi:putative ABC transport system permease protein
MSVFLQDLRYSLRAVQRSPAYTAAVVLTLALGIGGSTAIFSFVNGVLLRPLPYSEPQDLVFVCETHPERHSDWCGGSPANLWDWREASRTLETIGLGRSWSFGLKDERGKFRSLRGGVATVGMFDALRAGAQLGRLFQESDHHEGQDRVAILSHSLWQSRFGSDPEVLGRRLNLDENAYFVVGVLPDGFEVPYLETVELWIPLWSDRVGWRSWRGLRPYGRLAPGVTLAEARAEMKTIAARLAGEYPETNADWDVEVVRLQDHMVASVRPALLLFLGAVGLVLLIACANVANLLLTRTTGRQKELGLRAALGAGRGGIIRLLLTEGLVLALLGGGAGILLALWLVGFFVSLAPPGFPRLDEVRLDGGVLLFALTLSALTSLLFGILPAWQSSRVDLHSALKEGGRAIASGSSSRTRSALVVAEVALSLVLLVGAGLLLRSFVNLTDWEPGFETDHLVTFSVFPPMGKYQEPGRLGTLYRRINEELTSLPGVLSAGEVSAGPLFGGGDGVTEFWVEGRSVPAEGEFPTVDWFDCGPGYFRTMGIPLLQGRYFGAADDAGAPRVAIINETMARRHWPGEDPVGERLHVEVHDAGVEIVGVVADVPSFDPREPVAPQIYWPLDQAMRGATFYAVRTDLEPSRTVASIRAALEGIEPEMALGSVSTLGERIGRELVRPRFHMLLVGIFSGVAFLIAMIGIYGVISYGVARQAHEIGIRRALGAQHRHVLGRVLRSGAALAGLGVVLGTLGALGLTRLLQSLLVEVGPTDPWTFAVVALSVLVVSLLACAIPAWRAIRVDPMVTLRHE